MPSVDTLLGMSLFDVADLGGTLTLALAAIPAAGAYYFFADADPGYQIGYAMVAGVFSLIPAHILAEALLTSVVDWLEGIGRS